MVPWRMTLQEFLEHDDGTDHRYGQRSGVLYPLHPLIRNGQIVGMNPPVPAHQAMVANIPALRRTASPGPARGLALPAPGMLPDAVPGDNYVPDVAFTCEGPQGKQNLEQPLAVAEVLSPATMLVDLEEKRERYQQVPSIGEVRLAASREGRVRVCHPAGGKPGALPPGRRQWAGAQRSGRPPGRAGRHPCRVRPSGTCTMIASRGEA